MKTTTINNLAKRHDILLQGMSVRGRVSPIMQEEIDRRNIALLAIYEASKKTSAPLTHESLGIFCGMSKSAVTHAINKAKAFRRKAAMIETFKIELT